MSDALAIFGRRPYSELMEPSKKRHNIVYRYFAGATGILLALLAVTGLIALLAYGGIVGRDKFIGGRHDEQPSFSKDNEWGGLVVNIQISKKEIREPIAPKIKDCNTVESRELQDIGLRLGFGGACIQGEEYGGFEGGIYMEGELFVKNKLWQQSRIIPHNLLSLNYDGRQIKPKLENNIFGRYLSHGEGTSTKFSYEERYSAKDFPLYLNDDHLSSLVAGNTVEIEYN